MVILGRPDAERSDEVMTRITQALDAAFSYYATATGRTPPADRSIDGRTVVAEVHATCGAGCSLIGVTGIEIMRRYFQLLYDGVQRDNEFDHVLFYELGRNFWFWSDALAFQPPDEDPVVTGFAVWMRFRSMAAAGVNGAPFVGTPFAEFEAQVAGLIDQYEGNPDTTFAATLAMNRSPGAFGGTDFWASIMMRLTATYGDEAFVRRFWEHASRAPRAHNTTEAVTNWVNVASRAADADLGPLFYDRWGFPRPDGTATRRQ